MKNFNNSHTCGASKISEKVQLDSIVRVTFLIQSNFSGSLGKTSSMIEERETWRAAAAAAVTHTFARRSEGHAGRDSARCHEETPSRTRRALLEF